MSQQSADGTQEQVLTTVVQGSLPPIPLLRGEDNWGNWKYRVEMHLGVEGLSDCLTTGPNPEDAGAVQRDFRARSKISLSVDDSMLKYVRSTTSAHEAWKALCDVFEGSGIHQQLALLYRLLELRQERFSSLEKYVYAVKEVVEKMEAAGIGLAENVASGVLLKGLKNDDHFKMIRTVIERTCATVDAQGKPVLRFAVVLEQLMREHVKEEAERVNKVAVATNKGAAASNSNSGANPRWHPYPGHRGSHGGHRGSRGHRGGRGGNSSSRPWHNQQQQQTTSGTGTVPADLCRFCKRGNHVERVCWFNPDNPANRLGNGNPSQRKVSGERPQTSSAAGPPKWKVNIAKRVADSPCCDAAAKVMRAENVDKNKTHKFYLDSGSFDNLLSDPSYMQNYRSCPIETIECAGNQILHTEGEGTIHLDSEKYNGLSEIQVKYVPGLTNNLLSVSTLAKSNLVTVFKDNYGGVFQKDDIIIKGKPIIKAVENNGTYKVDLELIKDTSEFKANLCNKKYSLWHRRFGHAGKNCLSKLSKGLVDGISEVVTNGRDSCHMCQESEQNRTEPDQNRTEQNQNRIEPEQNRTETDMDGTDPCQTCLESKQTRAPLPKDGAIRATRLLGLVHSDVCEVTDVTSWEGYNYFVTFVDDYSRYTMVALLKRKNEVFQKFRTFQALVERHTGNKIKILRSDNGTEYCNKEFENYLKSEGIIRQLSVVDTPEQNGVAERINRTLLEIARALLKEAGLDERYWGVALEMAVYIKNLSPTKAVRGMVPYEAWTGIKPNVESLRIFGCLVYVHVSRKKSKKLGSRSKPCIFVGFDEEKKGFKLMDLNQPHKYFVERSVVFDESRFPAKELESRKDVINIGNITEKMG